MAVIVAMAMVMVVGPRVKLMSHALSTRGRSYAARGSGSPPSALTEVRVWDGHRSRLPGSKGVGGAVAGESVLSNSSHDYG